MNRYYLSFALPDNWLGGILVDAEYELQALEKVNALWMNPGGEVAIWPVPDDKMEATRPHVMKMMSTPAELQRAFGDADAPIKIKDLPPDKQDFAESFITKTVCSKHNKRKLQ